MRRILIILLLTGCTSLAEARPKVWDYSWFTGCWQTEDGRFHEVWSEETDGYLFGYALTYNEEGYVTFFEQMRFEQGTSLETSYQPTLYVYPAGQGPTAFRGGSDVEGKVSFINAENDYPQRITYEIREGNLQATISLLDGSNPTVFDFRPCPKD